MTIISIFVDPVSLNVKLACCSISHPHGVTKLLGEYVAIEVGSIPWAFPTERLFFSSSLSAVR